MPRQLMQSIRNGERHAGAGVLLGLVAVLCLLVASLGLTLDYRSELASTRQTIYERCLQREAYDRAAQQARQGQVTFYDSLLDVAADLPTNPDPKLDALQQRQIAAIRDARATAQEALGTGVTTPCAVYR